MKNNIIKKTKLTELVQEIVRRIVKEIDNNKIKENSTTALASPTSGKEDTIDEMTTTSAVSGYNIPGAFTNKLNNKNRIEVLGYTMTPEGTKEYNRPGDKKL